jgi:hypothetical protein
MNVTFATVDHRTVELDARVDYKLTEGVNHSSTRVQADGIDTFVLATADQVRIALDHARSAHVDNAEVRHEVIKTSLETIEPVKVDAKPKVEIKVVKPEVQPEIKVEAVEVVETENDVADEDGDDTDADDADSDEVSDEDTDDAQEASTDAPAKKPAAKAKPKARAAKPKG